MLRYTGSLATEYPVPRHFEDMASQSPANSGGFIGSDRDNRPANCAPLLRKLQDHLLLKEDETAAIAALSATPCAYESGKVLVHEGRTSEYIYLMVEGMACRYKMLPSGQRQILGYVIPFDLFELMFGSARPPDHSVALLSPSRILKIPVRQMTEMLVQFPRFERALTHLSMLDFAILREWLLNVGQRNAFQRLGHFFCEMSVRMSAVGQIRDDGSFDLPINQTTLADTTGLTCVHVNRTLQRLRSEELVALSHRRLTILDFNRLAAISGFDDQYLRFEPCRM